MPTSIKVYNQKEGQKNNNYCRVSKLNAQNTNLYIQKKIVNNVTKLLKYKIL